MYALIALLTRFDQMVFLATNVGLLLPRTTPVWVTFLIPVPYLVRNRSSVPFDLPIYI